MLIKLTVILKDIKNFGYLQSAAFVLYQLAKKAGLFTIITPLKRDPRVNKGIITVTPLNFPESAQLQNCLFSESEKTNQTIERLLNGEFLSFGMVWQPLEFPNPGSDFHWSKANPHFHYQDIKTIWEPARFHWVLLFARAYRVTNNKVFYLHFRDMLIKFINENPVNCGVNWQSGQEVALRLINLSIAYSIFYPLINKDEPFQILFNTYLKEHALRIKPTLIYAFAQNNNHLLSEAVGLLTASVIFKNDKQLSGLGKTGIFWLNYCLSHQFDQNGAYLQNSTNYHRMVLDLLVWVRFLERQAGKVFINTDHKFILNRAAHWLFLNTDYDSGIMANYGHNDGSYLFQFMDGNYQDARPTLQAFCLAYDLKPFFKRGFYDEKAIWFGFESSSSGESNILQNNFRLDGESSWAVLRSNQNKTRPGQADQNHVDLWYQGKNVICDAGTYSYNLPDPWHNDLVKTKVHNTITVNNMDQMQQQGTFRWRNWSCGMINRSEEEKKVAGEHNGYRHLGIIHARELINQKNDHWLIVDTINHNKTHPEMKKIRVHWLISDCEFTFESLSNVLFQFANYQISLDLMCEQENITLGLFRAGTCIHGDFNDDPILGWYSPTYLLKVPSLSVVGEIKSTQKLIRINTKLHFTNC